MSTTVPPAKYVSRLVVDPVSERRVITSEWLKLTTLRSSWVTMALGIGALAFLGGVINYLLTNDKIQHEYVKAYTNASFIVAPLAR